MLKCNRELLVTAGIKNILDFVSISYTNLYL